MSDWFYLADNQPQGPFAVEALKESFSTGALPRETLVWRHGMAEWVAGVQVPELRPAAQPSPSARLAATPPASVGISRLEQSSFFHGNPTIELLASGVARTETGRARKRVQSEVPLASLDLDYQHVKKWHAGSLIIAIPMVLFAAMILLTGLLMLFTSQSQHNPEAATLAGTLIVFGLVLALIAALLVFNAIKRRRNMLVFASKSGKGLELLYQNPDAATFDTFVSSLRARIEQARRGAAIAALAPQQPKGCAQCGATEIVPGYATQLCALCRTTLINFPIPMWIKAAVVVLLIIMLSSAIRIPREIAAAYHVERGGMDEAKGDYKAAIADYTPALAAYPKSCDVLADMARAAHRAGNQPLAIDCVNRIAAEAGPGGQVNKEVAGVITEVREANP